MNRSVSIGLVLGAAGAALLLSEAPDTVFSLHDGKAAWFTSRAAGATAYVLLALSTIWGLLTSSRMLMRWVSLPLNSEIHKTLSFLALGLTVVHGGALLFDETIAFSLAGIAVPFLSPYRPLSVGAGVLAAYLMVLLTLSFYVRRQIGGPVAWRVLHYTAFAAYGLATVHGVLAGTDSSSTWAQATYLGTGAAVLFLTYLRILGGRYTPPLHHTESGDAAGSRFPGAGEAPPELDAAATAPRVVVVGNGVAGGHFVQEVVRWGGAKRVNVVVFDGEACGGYNRVLLPEVLSGNQSPEAVGVRPPSWYATNGVMLHAGVRVARIDRKAQVVIGAEGVREPYDVLVLATGSTPIVPSLPSLQTAGSRHMNGVFTFRTMDDCRRIVESAAGARRAVVIGGGLVALEAASALLERGLETYVVHHSEHLMGSHLDVSAAQLLRRELERSGLHIDTGRQVADVLGEDRARGIRFEDGTSLECDLVIFATGARADVALARDAGLAVDRGIRVGDDLSTETDPRICAIGECAEHRGVVYGLAGPAREQARVLARRLTGADPFATYHGSRVSTRLKARGVALAVMGETEARDPSDEVVTYMESPDAVYKKVILREGRLAGAIVLGDAEVMHGLTQAFVRGDTLPDDRARLLFPGSSRASVSDEVAGHEDVEICHCNGVSLASIRRAMREGGRTLEAVGEITGAGTACGSCRPHIQAMLEAERTDLT